MSTVETKAPQAAGTGPRDLEGRVALVTGGARGIGAAISRSLATEGAIVAAGYSSRKEVAEKFQSELAGEGATVSIHQGNIGVADDCERVVREVIETHGRLDILVNNAGITADKPVLKMERDAWEKVLQVNLSGAFYTSRAALEHMLERGSGRIVFISSVIGEMGNVGQANYAASKSGLFGLAKTMAREAAQHLKKQGKLDGNELGVTVNCVAPGFIETEMLATVPDKVLDKIKAQIPLGRLGRPDEVGRVVHFLCADGSNYITGQVWNVNGGMEM
ncbi:MAG TPA: beta-ketoacyl-ACP reductase [Thermoleophilaceae bacterium]|jgi:acetoacetyl-CoA reductase/3-oxoacyl-[acyl-carrier protein] reductase|nr:beta-ketoacyl-ACP reductase [Thermoleophilaceae bacterium]